MDSALDKNQSELGVLVLPVPLKMLPDGHGLLDQIVAVLGELWGHTLALQDAEDLVASDESHLKREGFKKEPNRKCIMYFGVLSCVSNLLDNRITCILLLRLKLLIILHRYIPHVRPLTKR